MKAMILAGTLYGATALAAPASILPGTTIRGGSHVDTHH